MEIPILPSDLQLLLVTVIAVQWWALSQYSPHRRFFAFWARGWAWLAILIGTHRFVLGLADSEVELYLVRLGLVFAGLMQLYYFSIGAWLMRPRRTISRRQLRAGFVLVVVVSLALSQVVWEFADTLARGMAVRYSLRNLGLGLVFLYAGWLLFRQGGNRYSGATLVTSGCLLGLGIHLLYYFSADLNTLLAWATGVVALPYDSMALISGPNFLIDMFLNAGVGIGTVLLLAEEGRRTTRVLQRREAEFRGTFNEAPTGIALLDLNGNILNANRALGDLLELSESALVGRQLREFLAKGNVDLGLLSSDPEQRLQPRRYEVTFRANSGRTIPGFVHLSFLQDAESERPRVVAQLLDMTDQHNLQERLSHLAMHDSVTGLPNRAYFDEQLRATVKRMQRRTTPMALMFLDMDDFKSVNDKLGHEAGDQLLQIVAHRLRSAVREGDFVARFGGDEFTVILEECLHPDEAHQTANRIVNAVSRPVRLAEAAVRPRVSVGVVLSTPEDEADDLLREADQAMYHAKQSGEGPVRMLHPSDRDLPLNGSVAS